MAIPLPAAQTADSHTPRSHFPFSESTEELPVLLRGAGHDRGRASVKGPPKERCPGYALPHTNPTPVGPLSPAPVLALRPQPGPLICLPIILDPLAFSTSAGLGACLMR